MNFQEMDIKTLEGNPWKMIGDDWMLVAAKKDGQVNAMTASWGGVGIMWGKTAATIYLRPQRYTKEFVDANDTFTLSFFGGREKQAMGYLGKVSGRDEPDKISRTDLHLTDLGGAPAFREAELVLVCRKLYAQEMKPECFLAREEIDKWYPDRDFHTMYIAEIVKAYRNQ
ncbi:MAG TPA: flavin reductase [Candidatus Scatomonas pullistercoris]|uniref:Flavin reductase n=1 Tax=Candidatus Scatomonas pullistercoris TaxID=2840920 RepID=A0A9D1P363_9FIRM|nr:flavin reductase [Candidatus Scatomonas pullistercoris]